MIVGNPYARKREGKKENKKSEKKKIRKDALLRWSFCVFLPAEKTKGGITTFIDAARAGLHLRSVIAAGIIILDRQGIGTRRALLGEVQ